MGIREAAAWDEMLGMTYAANLEPKMREFVGLLKGENHAET